MIGAKWGEFDFDAGRWNIPAERMKMRTPHIELQLAHQERDDVSAAYNHALYLPQRAKMMQSWADHLDALRVANVVAMRRVS